MANITLRYDSVEALLHDSQEGALRPGRWTPESRQSVSGDRTFTGTATYSEATRLASQGWPEGRTRMVRGV